LLETVMAQVDIPTIMITLPGMAAGLVPIAWIEARTYARELGLPREAAWRTSFAANTLTTLLVLPVVWACLFGLQIVTTHGEPLNLGTVWGRVGAVVLQAGWLQPYEPGADWLAPLATIISLAISFLLSVWLECWIVAVRHAELDRSSVGRAVLKANGLSYGLLVAISVAWAAGTMA